MATIITRGFGGSLVTRGYSGFLVAQVDICLELSLLVPEIDIGIVNLVICENGDIEMRDFRNIVPENSTVALVLTFKDENGRGVVPSNAQYKITDEKSGNVVKAQTLFTPTSSTHRILITASENAIINNLLDYEVKRITVMYQYLGVLGAMQGHSDLRYQVQNLQKVPIT